jgi:hypothetical protein
MTTGDRLQRQMISGLLSQSPEAVGDVTIRLWESMAAELIPLIGKDGFTILYVRSLHLTRASFPWVATGHPAQSTDSNFTPLRLSFEGRSFAEAGEASKALLATFTDILAVLIGEPLTTGILHAAWGDGASATNSKEPPS